MSSEDEMYLDDFDVDDDDEDDNENENNDDFDQRDLDDEVKIFKSTALDGIEKVYRDDESDNEVLNFESLEKEMKKTISEVQAVLQLPQGACRILLQLYKWKKETLFERFYERPNTTPFLINAKINPRHSETDPIVIGKCEICWVICDLTVLACNHRACIQCWKTYLTDKIVDGLSEIKCMAPNCKFLILDEKVMTFITDSAVAFSYRRWIVNSYVETNKLLKWCPGINCGKALKVRYEKSRFAVCTCGNRFCFSCGKESHEPIDCRLLKLWWKRCTDVKQTQDAIETSNWILSNTKDCPKCLISIEKNGGCNHMSCKSCQYEFCWLCLSSWKDHNGCNRFDDTARREAQEKKNADHHRFVFYCNRFMAHNESLLLEKQLYATVESKIEQMKKFSMRGTEVQFLRKAVEVLSECRRTLMYSFAFAFYLQRDNHLIIFETNQKDLELATEELSGLLERDLENVDLVTLKQNVQDKYRYVDHRRKVLVNHCTEGVEQDFWVFSK